LTQHNGQGYRMIASKSISAGLVWLFHDNGENKAKSETLPIQVCLCNARKLVICYNIDIITGMYIITQYSIYCQLATRPGFARLMLILKCFSTILCMLYTYETSSWITLSIKKPDQNPFCSFKDLKLPNYLSIHKRW
jgi:uncharacterized membrane protein